MAEIVVPIRRAKAAQPQDVVLVVGGKAYSGWTDVSAVRSMAAAAGGFEISYTAGRRPGWMIEPGQSCQLALAGKPLIKGWIDRVTHTYDADGHTLTAAGRDATGDLVDCTALHQPAEWRGLTLLELAAVWASPFGVAVRADVETGAPFPAFRLEPGETAWEAIERAARLRGCLAMADGAGGLLITRAGAAGTASGLLTGTGGNVLAFESTEDQSERYSHYHIQAQRPGDADGQPADFAHIAAEASDPGVTRYRPLLLPAEDAADRAAAKARADWEAVVRRARAATAHAMVAGWTDGAGVLWAPNTHVRTENPWDGAGDWLIESVRYSLSAAGTLAELDLVLPEAFLTEPGAVATAAERRRKKRDKALDALLDEREEDVTW